MRVRRARARRLRARQIWQAMGGRRRGTACCASSRRACVRARQRTRERSGFETMGFLRLETGRAPVRMGPSTSAAATVEDYSATAVESSPRMAGSFSGSKGVSRAGHGGLAIALRRVAQETTRRACIPLPTRTLLACCLGRDRGIGLGPAKPGDGSATDGSFRGGDAAGGDWSHRVGVDRACPQPRASCSRATSPGDGDAGRRRGTLAAA